jgi:spore maturation protein CgeB
MKIAFFGSSLVSSYWNGACTYYRGLLKELASLGHEITFYEPDAYDRQKHRDIPDPSWARVVVYPATADGWQRTLEAAAPTDVLVKASGVGVFDVELEQAIPQIPGDAIRIFWDVDAPATLEELAARPSHHLHVAIPNYDAVLTYGGGDAVVRGYEAVGAGRCVPIYNALDPVTHHRVAPRAEFACDLSFLGNRLPDREARVDEYFLSAAALCPERRFLLGGAGWETKSLPSNVTHVGHVGTADHNGFFCSGLATLNVNRDSMARFGFSPPTRVFEAAGAGACIISDHWAGIEHFLDPGSEILVARNGAEVAAHVAALTTERARRMGEAARKRVIAHHTYAQRALEVTKCLEGMIIRTEAAE